MKNKYRILLHGFIPKRIIILWNFCSRHRQLLRTVSNLLRHSVSIKTFSFLLKRETKLKVSTQFFFSCLKLYFQLFVWQKSKYFLVTYHRFSMQKVLIQFKDKQNLRWKQKTKTNTQQNSSSCDLSFFRTKFSAKIEKKFCLKKKSVEEFKLI